MARRIEDWFARIVGARPPARQAPGTGQQAEALALAYLRARGAREIARNVRCRGGEIDLIVEHAGEIAFVEVRLRRSAGFGGAAASIGRAKQARIALAAAHWLAGAGARFSHCPCRFDALLLSRLDRPDFEWIRGAFEAPAG